MCKCPIPIKYIDRVRGGYTTQLVPCGKCEECLKDKQDEWANRILHEAAHSGGMIWDTFTYNNNSLPILDATGLDDEVLSNMSEESFAFLEAHNWLVPYPEYSDIRNCIKRGRELYYKHHGKRLSFKYFICSEYGDKDTKNYRPHFHLCVFGIPRATWLEYFAIPWTKRYGFVYTKEFDFSDSKHLSNIAGYVGKYCSKGSFEFCLVKDGIAPKPFRLVSNGVGIAYLDTFRKQMQVFNTYISEFSTIPSSPRCFYSALTADNKYRDLLYLFRTNEIWRHMVFYDTSGYCHKLPRYYKDKLFGIEPSIWKTALSAYLQHREERKYFLELQAFARASGFKRFKDSWNASKSGNISPRFSALVDAFNKWQESNNRLNSKRLYNKLKSFYL